jgi:hypothetical protein
MGRSFQTSSERPRTRQPAPGFTGYQWRDAVACRAKEKLRDYSKSIHHLGKGESR